MDQATKENPITEKTLMEFLTQALDERNVAYMLDKDSFISIPTKIDDHVLNFIVRAVASGKNPYISIATSPLIDLLNVDDSARENLYRLLLSLNSYAPLRFLLTPFEQVIAATELDVLSWQDLERRFLARLSFFFDTLNDLLPRVMKLIEKTRRKGGLT